MRTIKWLGLQLFADGASAGAAGNGGDGAATGVSADDAGRQVLRDLGVPEDRINKRAKSFAKRMQRNGTPMQTASHVAEEEQAAAAEKPEQTAEEPAKEQKRLTWDEIMADPEYNGEMQKVVQARLKTARAAQENLDKLSPVIEALCEKHGIDPKHPDYDALSNALKKDDPRIEKTAIQLGVSRETAERLVTSEDDAKRLREVNERREKEAAQENLNRMQAEHYQKLKRQEADLKKIYPAFDLDTELKNKDFLRLTAPGSILNLEQAYHALHYKEINAAAAQVTAQMTAEKMAASIRSNGARPQENGTSAAAPSAAKFDPRMMTRQERDDIRRRVKAGERVILG